MEALYPQCTECGRIIYGYTGSSWVYRTSSVGIQCSYTCNEHARLRKGKGYISKEKYWEYVKRNEESMKYQDKTILHPITKKVSKK